MKRIITLVLVLILAFSLCACDKNPEEGVALSYGDTGISEKYFTSEATGYKNYMIYYVFGFDSDSETVWDMKPDQTSDVTFGDEVKRLALEECASVAWVVDWAKNNGITLTEEDLKAVDEDIAALEEAVGGHEEYLDYIGKLGFAEEDMRDVGEINVMFEKGMDALTAKGGKYEITEEEIDDYFRENYVAVKHIFVNTFAEMDETTGEYVAISAEKLESQNERVKMYEEGLTNGDSFDFLYALSDDAMQPAYPNGMTITWGNVPSSVYEKACFDLEVGEWKRVDVENQGVYFVMRVEIPEEGLSRKEEVPSLIRGEIQTEIYNEYEKDFVVNEEFIDSLDVKALPVMQ